LRNRFVISRVVRTFLPDRTGTDSVFSSSRSPDLNRIENVPDVTFSYYRQTDGRIDNLKKELDAVRSRTESDLESIREKRHAPFLSETEIHRISENVIRSIEDRLAVERERRGYF
jgi:hypothetical protein